MKEMTSGDSDEESSCKKNIGGMFKLYILWSICADVILISGIIALLLGYGKISF